MKENLKNLALVLTAGAAAFFMRGGCSADTQATALGNKSSIEIHLDTVFQPVSGPVRVVVQRDTVIERVVIRDPVPVDTPVLIFYADDLDPDREMVIYEGEVAGDSSRCAYRYQAGVSGDTLAFLAIESQCTHVSQNIEVSLPPLSDLLPDDLTTNAESRLFIGTKAGWSPNVKGMQYGLHGAWRGLYGGANYAPNGQNWLFEVGAMLPIGKPKPKELQAPNPLTD